VSVYRVGRRRAYRGHAPGSTFEAALEPGAERRALARGDVVLIERKTPSLQPGSYTLPRGWLNQKEEV
jgi:hypothetical protein